MTIALDTVALPPRSERWMLRGVTLQGGQTAGGVIRSTRLDGGGLWSCEQEIFLSDPDKIRAMRSLEAQLDGGVTECEVPMYVGQLGALGAPGNFLMVAAMADPAALRATEINIALTVGAPLVGGEHFSITHATKGRRLYRVATVGAVVAGEQTITIRPPLREAVTTEALDFNAPSCVMRLANPDVIGALDLAKMAVASLSWIEAF